MYDHRRLKNLYTNCHPLLHNTNSLSSDTNHLSEHVHHLHLQDTNFRLYNTCRLLSFHRRQNNKSFHRWSLPYSVRCSHFHHSSTRFPYYSDTNQKCQLIQFLLPVPRHLLLRLSHLTQHSQTLWILRLTRIQFLPLLTQIRIQILLSIQRLFPLVFLLHFRLLYALSPALQFPSC